jgi:hypothetical protein
LDPQIITVREQSNNSTSPHYHSIILTNGRATKNSHYIHETVNQAWNTTLGLGPSTRGYVNIPNQYGPAQHMLDQHQSNFEEKLSHTYNQAEYLAKTRTKELNPKGS